MFYSFGYDKEIPFTKISLDFKTNITISLKTQEIVAPDKCSLVLVAGKYLDQLDEVMGKVDQITKSTGSVPMAVYLFKSYKGQEVHLHTHKR